MRGDFQTKSICQQNSRNDDENQTPLPLGKDCSEGDFQAEPLNHGKKKMRVGVIGVGHLGQHHARIYHQLDGCKLSGVVDIDADRAYKIAKLYNTKAYTDYNEIIPYVDAVSIVLPTSLHFMAAKTFLESGKDCLLEKPITSKINEGTELVMLANKMGLILQIGHLERFNPAILAIEERVNNPKFIESNRIAPFVERGTDVDVVLDLMIHDIDIIISLVNSTPKEIDAIGVPVITQNIDIANARIKFNNGCIANITSSRVSMKRERKLRIFQQDTYFSIDYANLSVKICSLRDKHKSEGGVFSKEVIQEEVFCEKSEPLRSELNAFLESVYFRKRPKVSGEDGLEALKVAQQIKDTIKKIVDYQ